MSRFLFSISLALATIATKSLFYLVLLLAFGMLAILSWNGSFKAILKIASYTIFFLAFIFMLHLFFNPGKVIFKFWFLTATVEGARAGLLYGLKLLVFSYAAGIIFLSVDPFELISPMERIAKAIGRPGKIIGALSLSFFLAIRFLPELSQQGRLTILSLKTRGFEIKGGLGHKARVAALLIVPMFVNAIKRAELAAAALNIKGYATRYSRAVFAPTRITLGGIITISISVVILIAGWRT